MWGDTARFMAALHIALAERTAELFRRRGELMATAPKLPLPPAPTAVDMDTASPATPTGPSATSSPPSVLPGLRLPCALPPERRLTVADLRNIELERRQSVPIEAAAAAAPAPAHPPAPDRAPPSGDLRRKWLRTRLIRLLMEDCQVCSAADGCPAEDLFILFELVTQEPYTQAPGAVRSSRLTGFSKALGNLIGVADLQPPLVRKSFSGTWRYSRNPTQRRDTATIRRQQLLAEATQPMPTMVLSPAEAGAKLVELLRNRVRIAEAPVDQGETSLALLLLWEAENNQSFPSTASGSESDLVMGFTRRLRTLVARDDDLAGWLLSADINAPLAPGLPPSHCRRWGVRIVPPTPMTPWPAYAIFIERWQARMRAQAAAPPPPPTGARRPRAAEDFQSAKRHRTGPTRRPPAAATTSPAPSPTTPRAARPRSPSAEETVPRPKRQSTLGCWLQPQLAVPPPHGRAAEGPPT
jgi:hypothetical protein